LKTSHDAEIAVALLMEFAGKAYGGDGGTGLGHLADEAFDFAGLATRGSSR
jgi:hypothetical protein